MRDFETILVDVTDGVVEITLNRPDKYNALNTQMANELVAVCEVVAADPSMRVLLVTGAGRGFCAGQDLAEVADRDESFSFIEHLESSYNRLVRAMRGVEKPIICAVNGAAAGAGLGFALAADLRYASEHAKFIPAFIAIGLAPDSGVSYWLPRLIGVARATEMLYRNERVSAEKAAEIGLVNGVFAADAFLDEARAIAKQFAQGAPLGFAMTKRALNQSLVNSLTEQLDLEAECQQIAGHSADYKEGVAAFYEKRPPVFTGK